MSEPHSPRGPISAREAEVLRALGDHLTNAEIATRLHISTRTVETHVTSLLRKVGVDNRRALARAGSRVLGGTPDPGGAKVRPPAPPPVDGAGPLPVPLTRFIGRAAERAALADAVRKRRLVTAVGPGGVGKTRLALAVAGDVGPSFADGVCYVDLVPVTDPAMVAPAVAAALGLTQYARTPESGIVDWLSSRQVLLVLDSCEHLADAVAVLVERLLAHCDRLTILATGRTRLLVPFEWAFRVPGLSLPADGAAGDAVTLFCERAAAAGEPVPTADLDRVAEICAELHGVALAVELAAARLPTLGLDGLRAGLADRLRLLTGRRRRDDRHQSLRATLDWSYDLLDRSEQAVLRRISVFAGAFTVAAAGAVATDTQSVGGAATETPTAGAVATGTPAAGAVATGTPTAGAVAASQVAEVLARLAEQSLVVALVDGARTRYRVLETVRQYAAERLREQGEADAVGARHLRWCLDVAASGTAPAELEDLRAALTWAAGRPAHRTRAHLLAERLGATTFRLGMPAESQRRYEQAAALAEDPGAVVTLLDLAAAAAQCRHAGDDALRLHLATAQAAMAAGEPGRAARALAIAAELANRGAGIIAAPPAPTEVDAWLDRAGTLAADDAVARARIAVADAYRYPDGEPSTAERAARAVALAEHAGDPVARSAALDRLTETQVARGELRGAMATARQRVELVAGLPTTADAVGLELSDALAAAADTALATGDLHGARGYAERVRELSFLRDEGHLATARLLVVGAVAGDWDEVVLFADRFRAGWERAGRPADASQARGAYAAATVFGMRGDRAGRTAWLDVASRLTAEHSRGADAYFTAVFDALLLLHAGRAGDALARLDARVDRVSTLPNGLWQGWYAALRAEAAVLAGTPAAAEAVRLAADLTRADPLTSAVVARAAALNHGDRTAVLAAGAALDQGGSRYQAARTLVLAGGRERARGECVLAAPPLRCA